MKDDSAIPAISGLVVVAVIAGLAVTSGSKSNASDEGSYHLGFFEKRAVKTGVRSQLKNPDSAEFGVMKATQDEDGTIIVCGYVNAKNSYGDYTGDKPFFGILSETIGFGVIAVGGAESDISATKRMCEKNGIPL